MGFLRKVAGIKAQKMGVDTWRKEGADMVIQVIRKKLFGNTSRGGR